LKISVVMATYNGEQFIEEQLDSIRRQTRRPDEVIISDDASDDRTFELLLSFGKRYQDFPMRLFRNQTNQGYRKNFRRAVALALESGGSAYGETSDDGLIFLADQDDRWHPEKIETMAGIFEKRGEISVLASSFTVMDAEGTAVPVRQEKGWSNQHLYHRTVPEEAVVQVPAEDLAFHNFAQGCAMAMKNGAAGRFLDDFSDKVPHDWQIAMSGAVRGATWFYNRPLFRYRVHRHNVHGLQADASEGRMKENYRLTDALRAREILRWTREKEPEYYRHSAEMQEAMSFLDEDIRCMTEHDRRGMLALMKNPEYGRLKSRKAQAADLLSVLLP